MFRIIYPNRWFIWAIVICVVAGVLLWWQVMLYSLDQELANAWKPEPHRKTALTGVYASTTLSTSTAGWKTYRNEKLGFELQYPTDWHVEERSSGVIVTNKIDGCARNANILADCGEIYIMREEGNGNEWVAQYRTKQGSRFENILIDGSSTQILRPFYDGEAQVIIEKKGYIYRVEYLYGVGNEFKQSNTQKLFQEFKNFLSTLKFFEPIDTSTWKTYRSATYGVTFKYPPQDIQGGGGDYQEYFSVHFQNPTMQGTTCKDIALNQIDNINNYGLMQSKEKALLQDPKLTGDASYYTVDGIRFYIDGSYIKQKPEPIKEQIVNGVHVLRIPFSFRCHKNNNAATFIDGKSMVQGVLWHGSSIYNFEGDQESFDKILSTLNFFESSKTIDISNWKTYHNNKYGFEFRYPKDYEMAENTTDQDSHITVGAVRVGVSSRQDAMLADQHSREFITKCLQDPSQYEGEEGFSGCGDVDSTATVKRWDSEKAFLENAKVGDVCQDSSIFACTVGIFQGKALEKYNSLCYEGCGAWKIYVFYHGPFRYEISLDFKEDRLSLEQMKKLEEDDPYVRMLNTVAGTLTFFNLGQ
ncbi:MAG TPA: hypothetical protein VJB56_00245 [Candidatus Paceibacterota bacterium]